MKEVTYKDAIELLQKRFCCEQPANFCTDNCMDGKEYCEIALARDALKRCSEENASQDSYIQRAYEVLLSYMNGTENNEAYVIETALGYLGQALE